MWLNSAFTQDIFIKDGFSKWLYQWQTHDFETIKLNIYIEDWMVCLVLVRCFPESRRSKRINPLKIVLLTQFLRRIKEDMFKFHFTLLVPQFCPQTLSLRLIYLQIAILFANRNKSRVQTAADNLTDRMARLVNKELTFYENSDCITKLFGKNEITHTKRERNGFWLHWRQRSSGRVVPFKNYWGCYVRSGSMILLKCKFITLFRANKCYWKVEL